MLKRYTPRKNGQRMKTKSVKVHIPESSIQTMIDKMGLGIRQAESEFVTGSLEVYHQPDHCLYLVSMDDMGETWGLASGMADDITDGDVELEQAIITF